MTPRCAHCLHWKHRFDELPGRGWGTCWDAVPAVLTREDDGCGSFVDRLANRAEVEAQRPEPRP